MYRLIVSFYEKKIKPLLKVNFRKVLCFFRSLILFVVLILLAVGLGKIIVVLRLFVFLLIIHLFVVYFIMLLKFIVIDMKTDGFKLSFHHEDNNDVMHYCNIYTKITFGNSLILVTLLPPFSNFHTDDESFKLIHYVDNHVKLTVESSELPPFLRIYVRNLFYGHFQYFCTPFYKSPALECVGYLKSIRNFLNRKSC